jgi:hypothetical protein
MRVLMGVLGSLLTVSLFAPSATAICEAIAPSVSCEGSCVNRLHTAFTIDWTNQSGCGCDEILVFVQKDCTGDFELEATLECDETQYVFCGPAGPYRFVIRYMLGGQQRVADIDTGCVECP